MLVAETITRRFFNVIQMLSHAVPIIAIQVNIVEAGGQRLLHFSKVLDIYEEPEEGDGPGEKHDQAFWQEKAPWTLDTARTLQEIVRPVYPDCSLNFVKHYIGINVGGNNYMWIHKRSGGKSLLNLWFTEALLGQAQDQLTKAGIPFVCKKQTIKVTSDKEMVKAQAVVLGEIAKLVKSSWEAD